MNACQVMAAALLALGLQACEGVSSSTESAPPPTVVSRDTTVLDGDTTQRIVTSTWRGSSLLSQTSAVVPVTNFVWLLNKYGSAVTMEAWAGDSLEWRNNHILGYHLSQLPSATVNTLPLAVDASRRLCARKQKELLVLVGLPNSDGSSNFLTMYHYRDVVAGDTLWLDDQGLMQRKR